MFWSRGSSRQRKAVLSALSAVGETGMTLLALGLAVNLPEGRLSTILEGLVRSGHVRRRGVSSSVIPGPRTAHYHLASGRHSAAPGPQPWRLPDGDRDKRGNAQFEQLYPAPVTRRTAASARLRSTRAHGF
jgi:hypothetical protein